MEEKDDRPVAREPWRRLLQRDAGAPPETTDARIRAAARRPLVRRPARWWLPASLAASFVLAFVLVQLQSGKPRAPAIVTESDVAAPEPAAARESPARDEAAFDHAAEEYAPRRRLDAEAKIEKPQPSPAERPESRRGGSLWAAPPATLPLPTIETPASERPAERESAAEADLARSSTTERELRDITVTGSRVSGATSAVEVAKYRTPEAWYAAIEALRAEGRTEEADRELERLEVAYPGWLEKNHPSKP